MAGRLGVLPGTYRNYETGTMPPISLISQLQKGGVDWVFVLIGQRKEQFVQDEIDYELIVRLNEVIGSNFGSESPRLQAKKGQYLKVLYGWAQSRDYGNNQEALNTFCRELLLAS
jgi:hypothetical protein